MGLNLSHVSVLPMEVIRWLDPRPGHIVVDATTGAGGHSALIWEGIQPTGTLIALDQDPAMLALAKERLPPLGILWKHGNFEDMPSMPEELKIPMGNAILAGLGFCSAQLSQPAPGP